MTIKHTSARRILFACLTVLLIFTTGCTAQTVAITTSPIPTSTPLPTTAIPPPPITIPRPPLSADEVKTIAAEFERITNEHIQAWANWDSDTLRQLYTDDIVQYDQNRELFTGIDSLISLTRLFHVPYYEKRPMSTFIGHDDGFYFQETGGWVPFSYMNTIMNSLLPNNQLKNYSWLTLRDGKISYWWLFWDEDVFSAGDLPFDRKLIQDYADAWSSGDSEAVASLYTPKAIRQDTLFNEKQQGNSAIKAFATHFFTWYPGVHMTLLETFGEFPKVIKRGGIYTLSVSDSSGQPCDINMLVLLEPDESGQKIAQEWLFYNADSLIACGWAQ